MGAHCQPTNSNPTENEKSARYQPTNPTNNLD